VRIVLDANVFISGVFFLGPPFQILSAWRDGKVNLVLSIEILDEYQRVGRTLAKRFPGVDLDPILDLLAVNAELISAPDLPKPVCEDPEDDKFLACAIAGKSKYIVSGDRHLLKVSPCRGVEILSPRRFVKEYLIER
jgi:putative PIN family toxin of toxin-antitoxin system